MLLNRKMMLKKVNNNQNQKKNRNPLFNKKEMKLIILRIIK